MRDKIMMLLRDLEKQHDIKILMASTTEAAVSGMLPKGAIGTCDSSMFIALNGTSALQRRKT